MQPMDKKQIVRDTVDLLKAAERALDRYDTDWGYIYTHMAHEMIQHDLNNAICGITHNIVDEWSLRIMRSSIYEVVYALGSGRDYGHAAKCIIGKNTIHGVLDALIAYDYENL